MSPDEQPDQASNPFQSPVADSYRPDLLKPKTQRTDGLFAIWLIAMALNMVVPMMFVSKELTPRGIVGIVAAVVLVALLGRLACQRNRQLFK